MAGVGAGVEAVVPPACVGRAAAVSGRVCEVGVLSPAVVARLPGEDWALTGLKKAQHQDGFNDSH